ncbi:hypothetical protein J3E69DRAFT_366579 [Trichoderma sp. SZMC 28015]
MEAIKRYKARANDGSITEVEKLVSRPETRARSRTRKEGDRPKVPSLLTHKYVCLYNGRIVIYVDTPWIQQMMFASMKMAGFITLTAQILIANINIMATGVNLHDACRVGVIVKDSFHDHQDRVMLTKWARQLSAESNAKSWLSGALREMVLFEIMKTYADLIDSNVFMVNTKGVDFEVEPTHSTVG